MVWLVLRKWKLLSSGAKRQVLMHKLELVHQSLLVQPGPGALWPKGLLLWSHLCCAPGCRGSIYILPLARHPLEYCSKGADWIPPFLLWELIPQID